MSKSPSSFEATSAAIYCRVSSDLSDVENSISAQLAECKMYCEKHGYSVADEHVFIEPEAISAKDDRRPSFISMMQLATQKDPPFKVIVVVNKARFMRNAEKAIVYRGMLRQNGVRLISVKEPTDDSPTGRLIEGVLDSVSEYQREYLAIETKRGMDQNARDGYSIGGRLYGYTRQVDKVVARGHVSSTKVKWVPDPVQASIVRRIFELYVAGDGYKKIADTLNTEGVPSPTGRTWHQATLRPILMNEAYLGRRIANRRFERGSGRRWQTRPRDEWIITENAHEPIVSEELFERAQAQRIQRASGSRGATSRRPYILTGLLHCSTCGTRMWGNTTTKNKDGQRLQYRHYRCRGSEACICKASVTDAAMLEANVLKALGSELAKPEILQEVAASPSPRPIDDKSELQLAQDELAAVRRKIGNLVTALEDLGSPDPDVKQRLKQLRRREEELQSHMNVLLKKKRRVLKKAIRLTDLTAIGDAIAHLDIAERKELLQLLVNRIDVDTKQKRVSITLTNSVVSQTSI